MLRYYSENGMLTSTRPDPSKKQVFEIDDIEISIRKRENVELDPIRKGIVTFFNESKGFGFIKDTETQESVFVHANNLLEEIKDNNVVSYEVEMGPKGPSAVRVKILR